MPRFVILEHDHPSLHWDFMLEVGEVLWTWRLSAPPEEVGQRIAAQRIGEHRRLYLDYEGPVSGGRGAVTRWDAGTYDTSLLQPDRLRLRLQGRRVSGPAELTRIEGEQWEMVMSEDLVPLGVDAHPLLDLRAFITEFPRPLGELASSPGFLALMSLDAPAPLRSDDSVREAVRNLLRHGGFKPTGRSKPASEYLIKAVTEKTLSSINLAVDACNVVSLHSGLPVSVVDLDRARLPLHVGVAPAGASYVFNASGQSIDVGGLLCLFDADGPCGSAVKDSQRTKTGPVTRRTLSLIWGTQALPDRAAQTATWYRRLLEQEGAQTKDAGGP